MSKKPDALLITDKSNILYLSNFNGSSGFMLLTKNKNYLFTDFRYLERAKKIIKKNIQLLDSAKDWERILKKHRVRTLGVEEDNLTVIRYKKFKKMSKGVHFKDASGEIQKKREIKSLSEIKLIEKSQRINEKVFMEIKKIIQTKKGITEIQMAQKIRELGQKFGAEDVSFDPIVAFGKNTSMPHSEPGNAKLKKNDIVMIDMGMKFKGYCSDMTRMIFVGEPTPFQRKIYNLVLEAQMSALKKIKAKVSGAKADRYSRDIIKKAGYAENYGHAGGHGIGLDIHESPALSEYYKNKLHANSIITVEPGIYLPGKFGVRIEDIILVKERGIKNLTKISKSI